MKPGRVDEQPQTREALRRDLTDLGVEAGQVLMVHSSLSAVGWVVGGAPMVVQAMFDALGASGSWWERATLDHLLALGKVAKDTDLATVDVPFEGDPLLPVD